MDIAKGREATVAAKFSNRGAPAEFTQPPKWTLYNENDQEIISGAASRNGNVWEAVFTVSNSYVVQNGHEKLTLQFTGYDNRNREYIRDFDITLTDNQEQYKPDGLVYNLLASGLIKDTIVLDSGTASFRVAILNPLGAQVGEAVEYSNLSPSSHSDGFLYTFNLPVVNLTANPYLDPYQVMIEYTTPGGTDVALHPLYLMDMKTINVVSRLQLYLDKAKLIEIDPALQWHPVELMQSVLEGVKTINASPPDGTFWTLMDFPQTLDIFLFYAAAHHALNTRYLAEGLQAFEFTGLNTQLNFNRTEALSFKISELQGLLERLPDAKRSAISANGKGTPPVGTIDKRNSNMGTLGITANLLNNRGRRLGRHGYSRFY